MFAQTAIRSLFRSLGRLPKRRISALLRHAQRRRRLGPATLVRVGRHAPRSCRARHRSDGAFTHRLRLAVDHGPSQREHDAGVRHHGDAAVETTDDLPGRAIRTISPARFPSRIISSIAPDTSSKTAVKARQVDAQATQGKGQPIAFIATDLVKVENGRITDNWHIEDNLTLLQEMGVAKVGS
jgi:hypothetical protein